jgi:hypothetical protein
VTGQYPAISEQDREDRRKHLELIQGVVTRLANASATIKGWSVTVAGAAFGVAAIRDNWYLWILGLAALVAFGALDVHYLKTERDFRNLHNATVDNHIPPFCLDPREVPASALPPNQRSPWGSWSVTKFYVPLLLAGLALTTIALCGAGAMEEPKKPAPPAAPSDGPTG